MVSVGLEKGVAGGERKRTEVGDGAETAAVRSLERSSLLEEGNDDGRQDQGGAVERGV